MKVKMPYQLKTLEKQEKINAINKFQERIVKYAQDRQKAKLEANDTPDFRLTDEEVLLLLEIPVFAKDALKGIQMYIPTPDEPKQSELP